MQKLLFLLIMIASAVRADAQNVGIDVNNPGKKLSVNGTIVVDYNSTNSGSLDSAALLFGTGSTVGITSNKNSGLIGYRGLDLWTNSIKRISINEGGDVGIGITGPQYKLHVGGEILATDYIRAGSYLRAGSGSFSNSYRLQINNGNSLLEGRLFVGGTSATGERLYVSGAGDGSNSARFANGNVIMDDNLITHGNATVNGLLTSQALHASTTLSVAGYAAIGGALDNAYKLRVYDGNARIGGDFHATGNVAIGGSVDNNYRLRVYDGNARVGGNAEITGELTTGTLVIGGNGSVRSNGSSPLRIGFDSKEVDVFINNNASVSVTANITDFSGDYDDVRVMISHVRGDNGSSLSWPEMMITVMGPDSGTNTVIIWITNKSGEHGILKGTIFLTSIARD